MLVQNAAGEKHAFNYESIWINCLVFVALLTVHSLNVKALDMVTKCEVQNVIRPEATVMFNYGLKTVTELIIRQTAHLLGIQKICIEEGVCHWVGRVSLRLKWRELVNACKPS